MFSTLPLPVHHFTNQTFSIPQVPSPLSSSPLRPSPLTPRNGNVLQFPRNPIASPMAGMDRKGNIYSRRVVKANPLIHNRDDGRETRRNLFLKKVRQESDDKRWDARGGEDEMMRTIWIAEQKRRVEKLARDASSISSPQEEDELRDDRRDEPPSIATDSKDEEMADEVAQQEVAEVEALLSMMETQTCGETTEPYERPDTPYSSDDEEYDQIFLEVIKYEEVKSNNRDGEVEERLGNGQEMMDMS